MNRRGFTIVELIIVITLMGILMTLGVINLRGSQAKSNDTERKVDVETIALHLETYYTNGVDDLTNHTVTYPSTAIFANGTTSMVQYLRDIDTKSITAPGISDPTLTFITATCSGSCVQTIAGVIPQPTKDQYVYQPLQSDGTLCTTDIQECRKFNLYYKLENATTDCPAPNNICMITSKNQ